MPPAFNLSQDQTLQFNSCYLWSFLISASLEAGRSLKILTSHLLCLTKTVSLFFFFVNIYYFSSYPLEDISLAIHAHIYWLYVVKDLQVALIFWSENCCVIRCWGLKRFVASPKRSEIMAAEVHPVNNLLQIILNKLRTRLKIIKKARVCVPWF